MTVSKFGLPKILDETEFTLVNVFPRNSCPIVIPIFPGKIAEMAGRKTKPAASPSKKSWFGGSRS